MAERRRCSSSCGSCTMCCCPAVPRTSCTCVLSSLLGASAIGAPLSARPCARSNWCLMDSLHASIWACRLAIGVRSWCAASAINRRCASDWRLSKPNSQLSERTTGRISSGMPRSSMLLRSRGERRSIANVKSCKGRNAWRTAQLTKKATTLIMTRLGSSTFMASCCSQCLRGSEESATSTTTSPATDGTRCTTMR